jgi:predicted CXXCH cytochrome family protein
LKRQSAGASTGQSQDRQRNSGNTGRKSEASPGFAVYSLTGIFERAPSLRSLLLILMAWGAASAAPFSHKLHLKLIPQCTTCHTAASASTKPEDNLLPAKGACAQCHKEGEVTIPPPPATLVAHFSHAQHLKMGNVAPVIAAAIDKKNYLSAPGDIRRHLDTKNPCQACHRGLEESDAVSKANMPQMADCLVCHNQIDNPFSCEQCHNKTANLKPASHIPEFHDTHSKPSVDKASCAVCHGRDFHCLGCH